MKKKWFRKFSLIFMIMFVGLFIFSLHIEVEYRKNGKDIATEIYSVESNNKGHIVYITEEQSKIINRNFLLSFLFLLPSLFCIYKGYGIGGNMNNWDDWPIKKK